MKNARTMSCIQNEPAANACNSDVICSDPTRISSTLPGGEPGELQLPPASFDLAFSSSAYHDIEDFTRRSATIHGTLVPGADFAFTIKHPIYRAPGNPALRWMARGAGSGRLPAVGARQSARRLGAPRVSPNIVACWGRC
jgi:hypothetical protein